MSEWWIVWQMTASSCLFACGGTKGKFWRRYVLPLAIGLPMGIVAPLWAVIAYIVCLSVALHIGYGDRASWWYRFSIFMGYSLPALFIGWSWWIVLTPILCSLIFLLSNFKPTASMFFWKGCEFGFGLLIAITLISTGGNVWK